MAWRRREAGGLESSEQVRKQSSRWKPRIAVLEATSSQAFPPFGHRTGRWTRSTEGGSWQRGFSKSCCLTGPELGWKLTCPGC